MNATSTSKTFAQFWST